MAIRFLGLAAADQVPKLVTALPGPKARAIIERDQRVISSSYTRAYSLVAVRGEGAIVEDPDGNRFLDFAAGIAVVATGHCHPKIVAAIQDQAARLIHMSGTDFYYENMVELAERLIGHVRGHWRPVVATTGSETPALTADPTHRVYFANSGTEAVEAAIKLARYHTGRKQFIAFRGAFHGRTMGSLALTASKSIQKEGFFPLMPGVYHAPFPDPYRCPYGKTADKFAAECVEFIEKELFRTILPPDEVAAIFVEPIQGEGGYLVPPKTFLQELRRLADSYGILLIFDEIQSGMGRTGKMFACEHFGVVPDVITLAKGIASGMPLGATIARAELMTWPPGAHATTFGGNPVSIAAALATLDLLECELMDNAARVGAHLIARLRELPEKYPVVGDVRGLGLMIGIEIVKDKATKERNGELRDRLISMCFERGLLLLGAGPNAIRICPPLIINEDQADFAAATIEECLQEL
ncbi:MAG: acetyl ornithine aminotransferase family protein [Bryobacterales bacterium]|nr:acetyl ornithine aminotransferase family protein [Bryobacterales bacterium]